MYEEFANFLIEQNFVRKNDYCLFSKKEKGIKLFVLSWVDDLVIAEGSLEAIEELKKTLETKFKNGQSRKTRVVPRHANK